MTKQLIADEQFTNIQKAQAGLTRLFNKAEKKGSFYRVLKNDKPLGILIPQKMWDSLIEDLEALSSAPYLKRIARARAEERVIPAPEVKRKLGIE
jgi:PHD/YefM family antitoxin component YafN of YafNO toxin-antitoxin module